MAFGAAILTGGASRRFGSPKAMATLDGVPLATRVAGALVGAGASTVVLVGGPAEVLAPLGIELVADVAPGEGPVGGVLSALERLSPVHDVVVVTACDLAMLDASTVGRVIAGLSASPAAIVAVAATLRREPALTAWRADAAPLVRAAFEGGVRAMHRLLDVLAVADVAVASSALANVNTPDELDSVACGSMSIREVNADELAELVGAGARLVDVRQPDEYEAGHVPGAVLVPLAAVPDRLDAFAADATNYVICYSGGRSMRVCEFLAAQGYDAVNVAGGTSGWVSSGRLVVRGDRPS